MRIAFFAVALVSAAIKSFGASAQSLDATSVSQVDSMESAGKKMLKNISQASQLNEEVF